MWYWNRIHINVPLCFHLICFASGFLFCTKICEMSKLTTYSYYEVYLAYYASSKLSKFIQRNAPFLTRHSASRLGGVTPMNNFPHSHRYKLHLRALRACSVSKHIAINKQFRSLIKFSWNAGHHCSSQLLILTDSREIKKFLMWCLSQILKLGTL